MKTRLLRTIPVLMLILAVLACSVDFGGSGAIPTLTPLPPAEATEPVEPPSAEDPTEEPTAASLPAPVTEEATPTDAPPAENPAPVIPPEGAFITTPNDAVVGLPTLSVPPVGIAGIFCEGANNGQISYRQITREVGLLCLYGANITIGAPAVTVNVTSPDGISYVQTYNIIDNDGRLQLADPHGNYGGSVYEPGETGGGIVPEPAIGISFFTGGYILAGQWTVSATSADNSYTVSPTTFTVERDISIVSDGPVPGIGPLDHTFFRYSSGETIHFFGAAYTPGQQIRLILYTADPGGATDHLGGTLLVPRNATTITVDANGRFEAQFVVGTASLSGNYYAITDDQFEADFEDGGFMKNPFVGAFTID